jgi:hypothetical protein
LSACREINIIERLSSMCLVMVLEKTFMSDSIIREITSFQVRVKGILMEVGLKRGLKRPGICRISQIS